MRSLSLFSALAAASAVSATPTQTTPQQPRQVSVEPITATGNAFFKGSERFYVRGIAYQPGGSSANLDPLADTKICLPDLVLFKELGVNVVRVYSTDNTLKHDECVNAYAEAGIYLVLDLNNPRYSINRDEPAPSYNADYLQSVFATIDEFAKFPNVMAFFTGNEVIHDKIENTLAAKYVKATTRDVKQYMRTRGLRQVLVGYSAADVSQNRLQAAAYFNCGTDDARSDFFAFNDYSWCSSDFKTAGWDAKVKSFTDYGVPIFLSEYGCIKNARDFGELEALMDSKLMTQVYSGGLMFEYTNETNGFGIVEIPGGPEADQTAPRTKLPEFSAFAKALKDYPAPTGLAGAKTVTADSPCPTKDANWLLDSSLLPALPEQAKKYFADGAGKGPGLMGPGSQNAGTTSTGDAPPGSGTEGATTKSSSAAVGSLLGPMDKAPFIMSAGIFMLTALGAVLL